MIRVLNGGAIRLGGILFSFKAAAKSKKDLCVLALRAEQRIKSPLLCHSIIRFSVLRQGLPNGPEIQPEEG